MINSPFKGWFAWLWSEALSCHLPSSLLRKLQAGDKAQWAKESWDWAQWHQHSDISTRLFQHIQALRGSAASTHWLFMAPPLGTRLCETLTQILGSKTQMGSSCAGGFAFRAWAVTVSFRQSWNSALGALWLLGTSLGASHTPFLPPEITPDIAAGPSWEAEKFLLCCFPFPSVGYGGGNAELHFEGL